MNRRRLLALAAAAPFVTRVFGERVYRVGYIGVEPSPFYELCREALEKRGYREGQNVRWEKRSVVGGGVEQMRPKVQELVDAHVDVILALGSSAALAAKSVTRTVPIVAHSITNPVRLGIVDNLSRPGGNVTGVSNRGEEIAVKKIEMLRAIKPVRRLGYFFNPRSDGNRNGLAQVRAAFKGQPLEIVELPIDRIEAGPEAMDLARGRGVDAYSIALDGVLSTLSKDLAEFGLRQRIPGVGGVRPFLDAGGLATYGQDTNELVRISAEYVDRLLKGAKVRDLPVQQADKVEFGLNLRTARALSIDIPRELLARADVVVE